MWAISGVGISTIVDSWDAVKALQEFYPYTSIKKIYSKNEGVNWLNNFKRLSSYVKYSGYGLRDREFGYIEIRYITSTSECLAEIYGSKLGKISYVSDGMIEVLSRTATRTIIKVNTSCDLTKISSHIETIQSILAFVGDDVDVNIILDNFSIYYALLRTGKNGNICGGVSQSLKSRRGVTAYSIQMR